MELKLEVQNIEVFPGISTELRYISVSVERPGILILPALGVPAMTYDKFLIALARSGYSAAIADLRGQGKSSVVANRGNNYGYLELLCQDIPAFVRATNRIFDGPFYLLGHSLGGQLSCLYSTKHNPQIKGLILCTSGSVYFKCWRGKEMLQVLMGSQLARLYSWTIGYFPGRRFRFGDRTSQRLIDDWGRQALTGKYIIWNDSYDREKALAEVNIPTLVICLEHDFLAPPTAVKHLCAKLKIAPITFRCLQNLGLDHFRWLKRPDRFVAEIVKWTSLQQRSANMPQH